MVAPASGPMCRSSASARAANPGLWSIDRQTITASRPPGASTLAISARAAGRSGKYWRPSWQQTTSKLRSGNGMRTALACTHPIGAPATGSPEATASIPGLRSRPATWPSGPTRSAASLATTPVPQAASSARSPAAGAARATTRGAHGPKIAGTSSRW
jgi:hypothetical protein